MLELIVPGAIMVVGGFIVALRSRRRADGPPAGDVDPQVKGLIAVGVFLIVLGALL